MEGRPAAPPTAMALSVLSVSMLAMAVLLTMAVALGVDLCMLLLVLQHTRPHVIQVRRQQADGNDNAEDELGHEPLVTDLVLLPDDVERAIEAMLPTPSSHQGDACGRDRKCLPRLPRRVPLAQVAHDVQHPQAHERRAAREDHLAKQQITLEEVLVELPLAPEQETPGNQHDQHDLRDVHGLVHGRAPVGDLVELGHGDARPHAKDNGPDEHEKALPSLVLEHGGMSEGAIGLQEVAHGRVAACDGRTNGLRHQERNHQANHVQL
mmetsp:Transcript_25555/g.71987  ORF Transcript_25555/g.71987 Transcript_25555/m.71987 type:complete len:266 (+) Transcript_25555:76-873(+)